MTPRIEASLRRQRAAMAELQRLGQEYELKRPDSLDARVLDADPPCASTRPNLWSRLFAQRWASPFEIACFVVGCWMVALVAVVAVVVFGKEYVL